MTRFQFRFARLLKLRDAERLQRRLELAQALQADQLLEAQLAALAMEAAQTRGRCQAAACPGHVNVDRLLDFHRYSALLKARAQALRERQVRLRDEIERRRQTLTEADRQVRVLEKLCEHQYQEHCAQESRQDMKDMDEVAQRITRVQRE